MHRSSVRAMVLGVAFVAALAFGQVPASADGGDRADADSDGTSVTGNAQDHDVDSLAPGPTDDSGSGGSGGPNCTRSDGTRDYYAYEPLQYTTMDEQYSKYRPEEQRPGVYLHVYCGAERLGLEFFPDAPDPVVVDPRTLASTVTITPPPPVIRTSPEAANHLVGVEAWFWVDTWDVVSEQATAGAVSVTVSAEPTGLIVDPGDGSPTFTCVQPPAYDLSVPADAQTSDCTHVYETAGAYTATATLVYDTSFTANLPGQGGPLAPIDSPAGSLELAVAEAQAINTG